MTKISNATILKEFKILSTDSGGIESWITKDTDEEVFRRLGEIATKPVTKVQLNQLLAFGHEAPVSDSFFEYYWLSVPPNHPYDVTGIDNYQSEWCDNSSIQSLEHLKWGLYRLYIDGLLWFGNVRSGFRSLRSMSQKELEEFFISRRFDSDLIKKRGPALPLEEIARDDRYLISEMACKSFGEHPDNPSELKEALLHTWTEHVANGGKSIRISQLLEGTKLLPRYKARQEEFEFSADTALDHLVRSEKDLERKIDAISKKFFRARTAALKNTRFYLSMVGDLDVYVATSMRTRDHFREMASTCEDIFGDDSLKDLQLRYFDPTKSAAQGHEDKGLIECLMVKCAKVLVYCAGERDSYGKDAEAAMALSLGKPVIFYCSHEQRGRFYKEVHPLSRLIEFSTGVAMGAIVTDSKSEVSELLSRIFENRMEYSIVNSGDGYLKLKENMTNSIVRLQTNDRMLNETFWNHYHGQ